jgi:hypothetical protein
LRGSDLREETQYSAGVVFSEVDELDVAKLKGNLTVSAEDRNNRDLSPHSDPDSIVDARRADGGGGEDHQQAGAPGERGPDRTAPALAGGDVQRASDTLAPAALKSAASRWANSESSRQ